jgi:monomeric isocitrate dehydrogenase
MVETGMGTVVSVLEKLGAESMSIDIEKQEVAFTLNDSKYLYKVNVNVLSKKLWKTYYSADWFKEYTEELDTLAYNINKGIVDNPKIIEQREEYKIKDRELKIWQEPGFAVLIASTLILVGYLIGAFV